MDALFGRYLEKHGLFTIGVLAVLAAGLIIFLPTGDDKLNTAVTNATITNQEAINTLLDENQSLKEHINTLVVQMCYIEAISSDAYAKTFAAKDYAGFDMQSCIKRLSIVSGQVNS